MARGHFSIVIEGFGPHHSGGLHDADKVAARVVNDLMNGGHLLDSARFVHGDSGALVTQRLPVAPRGVPAVPEVTPRPSRKPEPDVEPAPDAAPSDPE